MRKKYLSALLFGALVMASTATFTSCKDYDDDIDNLQGQINSNKDAIAALQQLVGQGKWVAGISAIENGFTVTMSDGSTQTVKGINGKDGANGKDGKDGTQWTISEDGFWVCDGEKTEFVAVGKDGADGENGANGENGQDGKNGLTAPSPQISANGNWIVYTFNEATGEFEAEETAFSAIGTAAYVVLKDNAYELNIADQSGQYQQIVLPATADSFIATAPAQTVYVTFESAKWNPTTTNKAYQQLVAKFPELAEIEKNTVLKQGGHLPVLINPGNVELTDQYSYSLQNIKGVTADVTISNPVKGLINADVYTDGWGTTTITTRSAEDTDCFWTLNVEPKYDEKKKEYVQVSETSSLVIKNQKGTVIKTAFAYLITSDDLSSNVYDVRVSGYPVPYAASIDLLASYVDDNGNTQYPIEIENGYEGKYIITLADQLQVEKYDLSMAEDGHTLNIGNMPKDVAQIDIKFNVIALGLNGSVANCTSANAITVSVTREMVAEGQLADMPVTLKYNEEATPGNELKQNVLWNVADLKFTATQLNNLFTAYTQEVVVSYVDENGDEQIVNTYGMLRKKNNGTTDATGYADFAKMGFVLNAEDYKEGDYKVLFSFKNSDGSVIYSAEAKMIVKNPTVSELFSLASAYTEDGILQVVGTPNLATERITYTLENGIVAPEFATLAGTAAFVDMDYKAWTESMGSESDFGAKNWIALDGQTLTIYTYGATDTNGEKQYMLDKERNVRATYYLFNNTENEVTYDFKVKVKSAIYSDDASKAIKLDDKKLTTEFGGDPIELFNAVKGIYVAGIDKGKEYNLFGTAATTVTDTYQNYAMPSQTTGGTSAYVLTSNSTMVEVALNDMNGFGYTSTEILDAQQNGTKYFLTVDKWTRLWNAVARYYDQVSDRTDTNKKGYKRNSTTIADADKAKMSLFDTYSKKIAFIEQAKVNRPVAAKPAGAGVESATFSWVNENEASKYVNTNASDLSSGTIVPKADINTADLTEGKAVVNVKLTVLDKWGKKMIVNVPVTITPKK